MDTSAQIEQDACDNAGGNMLCGNGWCSCSCSITCTECMDNNEANCPDNPAGDDCWWNPLPPCPAPGCCLKDGWIWDGAGCVQDCGTEGDTCVVGGCCSGLHCSTIDPDGNPLVAPYRCFPNGETWSSFLGQCMETNPCNPLDCTFVPTDPEWWIFSNNCWDISGTPYKGCCPAFEYGLDTHVWEDAIA